VGKRDYTDCFCSEREKYWIGLNSPQCWNLKNKLGNM
jgi:hypothetical protein